VKVSLFPLYLAIIFSFSRGAWLGLIAAMLIYALTERKTLWVFVIMTLILIGLIIGYSPVSNRFASITDLSFSSNLLRFQIWKTTWNMIKHHPYLGIGMGNFMVVFRDYAPPDFQNRAFPFAHNIFLQILAEGGILTLFPFTAIIILTFLKGIRIIKYSQGFPQKIGLASTVALVAILIQNQFDCTIYSFHMGPLFWMLVGLICFTEKKINLSKKIDK
jgi:O-antigen ligase